LLRAIAGADTIDASRFVVAPGFIDTHFHAVDPFATKMSLRDGVTTGMDLELGAANGADWYDKKENEGWQVNYGTTASLNLARMVGGEFIPIKASTNSAKIADGW
jgi:N-acyl-D-amino-acid deacylase